MEPLLSQKDFSRVSWGKKGLDTGETVQSHCQHQEKTESWDYLQRLKHSHWILSQQHQYTEGIVCLIVQVY